MKLTPVTLTALDQRRIALVLASVDGGCGPCGEGAAAEMNSAVPAVNWTALLREVRAVEYEDGDLQSWLATGVFPEKVATTGEQLPMEDEE